MVASDDTVAICNRRAVELLDLPPEFMAGQPTWQNLITYQSSRDDFEHSDAEYNEFVCLSAQSKGLPIYDREGPNGTTLEVRTAPMPGGKGVRTYTDITERKLSEKRIAFMAHHDSLAGLANRVLLMDRLTQALGHASRRGYPEQRDATVAVLAVDLDHFKEINDAHGHDAGDEVLVQVAERLRKTVRKTDTVARTGGDEFVVVQSGLEQPMDAVQLAQRLIDAFLPPFDLAGIQVKVGTSLGIAVYPTNGDTASKLLKNVDIALYRAKSEGSGNIRLFEPEMDRQLRDRRELGQALRAALGTDQLEVYFQPQFISETGTITGFEALLRWKHPVRGDISPSVFIPIAEESKLIVELGWWVLEAACAAAASWSVPHRVSVNLSPAQFRAGDLPDKVAGILHRTGLPALRLELEVTEMLLIDDTQRVLESLLSIKAMGVRIALDDFGTGYSSLSYLAHFPFDHIKVHPSHFQGSSFVSVDERVAVAVISREQLLVLLGKIVEQAQRGHPAGWDMGVGHIDGCTTLFVRPAALRFEAACQP
jgi:diguanylate cyclase (GGDEF)-like protein